MSSQPTLPRRPAASLPPSVHEAAAHLESHGFAAWLTGESWMQLLLGQTPPAFELTTSASVEQCLDQFEQAVPTHPGRGVVTLATGEAPLDLSSLRAPADLSWDLAHRDFTVLAMAYRLTEEELVDPYGGLADLQQERLRWVDDPDAAISADPLRMMRAARLVGEYGFDSTDVEAAIGRSPCPVRTIEPARTRRELIRTLLSDHPAEGLGLLRRTKLERQLVHSVRPDSGTLVAALPRRLPVRMAAWLRGTQPKPLLRQLRFGVARSQHVEQLLGHHPLDEQVNPNRDRAISRLLRQLDDADIASLVQMREWELAQDRDSERERTLDEADVRKKLEAIQHGIERIRGNRARVQRRTRLALDGSSVMELLGCEPGRRVGAALVFATELVARDPSRNEEAQLREALLAWDRENPERES